MSLDPLQLYKSGQGNPYDYEHGKYYGEMEPAVKAQRFNLKDKSESSFDYTSDGINF